VRDGLLILRKPLAMRGDPKRKLYVTPYIDSMLDGKQWATCFPHPFADDLVATYIAGWTVTASPSGDPDIKADFKRVRNVDDVWALCFRKPKPGWRALGRFLGRDEFVAVSIHDRHDLAGKRYEEKAREAIVAWHSLLGPTQPVRSADLDDYLGPVVRNEDEENS
jgi:hypothetical protein